jgi:signal transduction histidine kinase
MSPAAAMLPWRALALTTLSTLIACALLSVLSPHLLLLSGSVADEGAATLAIAALLGGAAGLAIGAVRVRRYRFVLRTLALGSSSIEPHELAEMSDEPRRLVASWAIPSALSLLTLTTVVRPKRIDLTTGITLCLLGLVIVAAVSLPLFALIRSAFLKAFELAPHEVMREVVESAEQREQIGERVSRRMVIAVTAPVAFLAMGSALVVSAHLRRADERHREESARVLARAALEQRPGLVLGAGLRDAIARGRALGFSARVAPAASDYRVSRGDDGIVSLVTPLDEGSAEVRFSGSTAAVLSLGFVFVALAAAGFAGALGTLLGSALGRDLRAATRDVQELGTEAVMSGGRRVVRFARFRMVERLGRAIEQLAGRFRVFAEAQERSIEARKRAARMRGLFFASVSHDLKSPLNAILGFAELVRKTELLPAQLESLNLIDRRGRELLALIETILDAARVEAGQLSLVLDRTDAGTLLGESVAKGKDLGGDRDVEVYLEVDEDTPALRVDRVRMPRALATFIGHAVRTAQNPAVHVRVAREANGRARIDIEVPNQNQNPRVLEAMLAPSPTLGPTEHRGLALGLRLARSVVELHGGSIEVSSLGAHGAAFSVLLPGAA